MTNTLKMKNGTTKTTDEKRRNGHGREVIINEQSAKITFREGGARRFMSVNKAEDWVYSHNFKPVSQFSLESTMKH